MAKMTTEVEKMVKQTHTEVAPVFLNEVAKELLHGRVEGTGHSMDYMQSIEGVNFIIYVDGKAYEVTIEGELDEPTRGGF